MNLGLSIKRQTDWTAVRVVKATEMLRMRNVEFGQDHYAEKTVWNIVSADGTFLIGGKIKGITRGPYKSDAPMFPTRKAALAYIAENAARFPKEPAP